MIIRNSDSNGITFYYYIGNHEDGYIGSCITTIKNKIVKIDNIEINYRYRNNGYGTFLIKYVINYFKYYKKKKIYGIFCPESKNDHIQLYKFYKKNGFTFFINKNDIIIKYLINKI